MATRGVNKCIILGNLGQDPEIRRTQSGDPIATLNVATSESWRDKTTGEEKSKTEWHRIVLFGKIAEIAEQYLKKGSQVYVEGQLQTRKWTDQQGVERYTTEIVVQGFNGTLQMVGGRSEQQSSQQQQTSQSNQQQYSGGGQPSGMVPDFDDSIPF